MPVTDFRKKASSEMFDWVLNTPLDNRLKMMKPDKIYELVVFGVRVNLPTLMSGLPT